MSPTQKGFQEDIHTFRAIAIILIVAMHSLELGDWSEKKDEYKNIGTLFGSMSILFFFISGYLFQHLSSRFEYRAFLITKFRNVVLPYIIISIPAIVVAVWFIPQTSTWDWFYDQPKPIQILLFYATGKHLEPLWFVPTMVLIYLMAPLLLKMDRTPNAYWLLPVLLTISVLIGRDGPSGPLHKAVYMLPAYVTGMFASHYRAQLRPLLWRFIVPLALLTLALYAIIRFNNPFAGTQVLFKIALSLLIWTGLGAITKAPTMISNIANASFGIYFLHGYILAFTRLAFTYIFGTPTPFTGGSLPTVAATAIVLALSMLAVQISRRVFGRHSRQIIGA